MFSTKTQGIFPKIIEELYDERKLIKKKMIGIGQKIEGLKDELKSSQDKKRTKEIELEILNLERERGQLHSQQMARKLALNALYGAMANTHFRYFSLEIAESITISGQLSIQWAEKTLNDYFTKLFDTKREYILMADTDSLFVNFEYLVKKMPEMSRDKTCAFIDKVCNEKIEPLLKDTYQDLADYMHAYKQKMNMKREKIMDKLIITGKKRYIANVLNNEGVQYAEPKISVTGIESVRSSTPKVCRKLIETTLKLILNTDEFTVQQFLVKSRDDFLKMDAEEVAFPRGVSDLDKYVDDAGYKKGTPIHVRAAYLYNTMIIKNDLTNKYRSIRNGDKIKFLYMKVPNPIHENVFGFPDVLPKELDLEQYIDYDTQFDKSFIEPIKTILDAVGWKTEHQNTLEGFFS